MGEKLYCFVDGKRDMEDHMDCGEPEPTVDLKILLEDKNGIIHLDGYVRLTPSDLQDLARKTVDPNQQ